MSQCTVSSNIAENKTNLAYNAYQAKVINALDNLFGRASQARIKQVQTLGKFSKVFMRKLKSDYAKHLGLFNPEGIKDGKGGLLFDFLMQNGMETEFEVDPVVKVDELQAYLYDKTGQLVNHSILYGKYGLSFGAVDKHIRRVIDASKKITPFQRAWYPISIFPRADRFGYISRLARKMKTLSDRQRQDTKDITKKYTAHRKAAKLFIENLIDTGKLNINNGAMDGLNPRDGLYTVNGERIILHKKVEGGYQVSIIRDKEGRNIVEKDENGADIPLNQVPYSELEKVFLPQEELKSTTEDIKQALIQKYVDELVNDLSHGQTREVKFQTIPTGYKQREKWKRESQDGIIVTDILDAMAEKKYTKEDKKKGLIPEGQDVGDVKEEAEFAPDVYTQNVITKGADGVAQARTIRYVMVKQGIRDKTGKILEHEKGDEIYHAYILDVTTGTGKNKKVFSVIDKNGIEQKQLDSMKLDGFYKSDKHQFRGYKYGRSWVDMTKMKRQPNKLSMESLPAQSKVGKGQEFRMGIKNFLKSHREIYWEVQEKIKKRDAEATQFLEKARNKFMDIYLPKMKPLAESEWDTLSSKQRAQDPEMRMFAKRSGWVDYRKKELAEEKWNELLMIGNLEMFSWVDSEGNIHTPNSYFQSKQSNYAPALYRYGEAGRQIDVMIRDLSQQLDAAIDEGEIASLESALQSMMRIRDKHATQFKDKDGKEQVITDLKSVYTKERARFTDLANRRKDADVMTDYIDKLFRGLHRNILLAEVVDVMVKMDGWAKDDHQRGLMDWVVNTAKKSLNDPDYDATISLFGREVDLSNRNIANHFNKVARKFGYKGEWDEESAQRFTLTINGLTTMRYLGIMPALGNRTQVVNNGIRWGFNNVWEAHKEWQDDDWQDVVAFTGVNNTVSMFNDVMLEGADATWSDAGMVTSPLIKLISGGLTSTVPTGNIFNFADLVRIGRNNFIAGISEGDNQGKMIQGISDKLVYIKSGKRFRGTAAEYKGEAGERIEDLRKAYWDLIMGDETQEAEVIEKRIKYLTDEVSDGTLKRMVAWKLSWAFGQKEGSTAAALITFTSGELALRSQTVVTALKFAQKLGLLGESKMVEKPVTLADGTIKTMKVDSALYSDRAVRIARAAVYSTQFGMSQVFLGDGLGGLGRTLGQYKAYPIQQIIHDNDILANWYDKKDRIGSIRRLFDTALKLNSHRLGLKLDPHARKPAIEDLNLDRESVAVLRLLSTRMMASFLASLTEFIPAMSYPFRLTLGFGGMGMVSSAEHPLIGMVMRVIMLAAVMSADGGDDDELNDLFRLILPPAVSWMLMFLLNLDDVFE